MYTYRTRPLHGRVRAVYAAVIRSCTGRLHGRKWVHGYVHNRYTAVYGRLHGRKRVHGRVTRRVYGRVHVFGRVNSLYTAVYTSRYTAVYTLFGRVNGRTRPHNGRVHFPYTALYTAVYGPCTRQLYGLGWCIVAEQFDGS